MFKLVFSSSYFTERFNFSEDSTSATSLVYMQGVDDAKNSLAMTYGLGLGFQMLGTQEPSIYSLPIAKILGADGVS